MDGLMGGIGAIPGSFCIAREGFLSRGSSHPEHSRLRKPDLSSVGLLQFPKKMTQP